MLYYMKISRWHHLKALSFAFSRGCFHFTKIYCNKTFFSFILAACPSCSQFTKLEYSVKHLYQQLETLTKKVMYLNSVYLSAVLKFSPKLSVLSFHHFQNEWSRCILYIYICKLHSGAKLKGQACLHHHCVIVCFEQD